MRIRALIQLAVVSLLFGCEGSFVPDAKPTTGRLPSVAEVPDPEETVQGLGDQPIVTLPIGKALRERRLSRTEDLPSQIIIPNTNLSTVPVAVALQAVLAGTDISLSWDSSSFEDKLVTVANLSGPLSEIVPKICRSARVFCSYRDGMLEIKETETFIVELPAALIKKAVGKKASSAATNTMAETIRELAGSSVRIDAQGGNLIYTSDVDHHERVQEYLTHLRRGRPLIVMKLYLWEVRLDKDHATGIHLNKVSRGADAETVLRFLKTKGLVQTISNPQLTFVSGSTSEFHVGGAQRYISQVGELASENGDSPNWGNNTISTDQLETGLTVIVNGAYENGVISAYLTVTLQDLVSLNKTTTSQDVTIDLPETSERTVETTFRVRPGDNLVLAGFVSSRDQHNIEKAPTLLGDLKTYKSDYLENTEIVMLVKPSVVLFSDTDVDQKNLQAKPQEISQPPEDPYIFDAFIIDSDGVQKIRTPDAPLVPTPWEQPISGTVPSTISDQKEHPLVNEAFIQRGFSHAFEELQSPQDERGRE